MGRIPSPSSLARDDNAVGEAERLHPLPAAAGVNPRNPHGAPGSYRSADLACVSLRKDERRDDADENESDQIDQHIGSGIAFRESVPDPIGNVRRYRSNEAYEGDETDPADETGNARLGEEKHGEKRHQ